MKKGAPITRSNPKGKRYFYRAYTKMHTHHGGFVTPDPMSSVGDYLADTAHDARLQAFEWLRESKSPHHNTLPFRDIIVEKRFDCLKGRLY